MSIDKLGKVKTRLGIPAAVTTYDDELTDLIAEADKQIIASGVPARLAEDERFVTAQVFYCRARYGSDRSDTNRNMTIFNDIVFRLALEEGGS